MHPALGARMVAADAEERKRAEDDPLSDRERDVLRLLALGHTNQEIASQLYISVRTAETHRAHIMQKLRIATRAELVRYAIQQGLLESGRRLEARSATRSWLRGELRALHPNAGVDDDAGVREREHRVEVELGDGGDVLTQAGEAQKQVGERRAVGGRGAAEASHEPSRPCRRRRAPPRRGR